LPLSAISRREAPADPAELFRLWLQEAWHIATSRTSRKGRELAANLKAALNFYWPRQGRQVRVAGRVLELSAEASAADWQERPAAAGSGNPDWRLYAVSPLEIEFWQARHDRRQVGHLYRPAGNADLR
jgi:pyridoxamine 5'-phosphate oxidase